MNNEEALKLLNDIQEKVSHFDLKQTKRDIMEVKEYVKEIDDFEKSLIEEIVGLRKTVQIYEKALKRNDRLLNFVPNDSCRGTLVHIISEEEAIILDGKDEFYKNNKSLVHFREELEDD